ncbi:LsmAD domain-containing protein [Cynara cardunculus var. scolymus]|uniref:LsmAD domain-containing protein n=5 Tax=Asteraceae TaxID=4210 RepID=A0A124SGB3_CYNCS|nr:LsmAD domain-containing protein [Cynara cardunculus var. scolymus]
MNLQQVAPPRSSANGFSRRRGEKEMGIRVDNKSQSEKSNFNKMTTTGLPTGNKGGVDSPSRQRLVYLTTCLIGHQVEVQVTDGSVFSGIFHATNAEDDFGIILKMACMTKSSSSQVQKNISDSANKAPSKTLIIPANDLVQIVAKSVPVTRDWLTNELQHEKPQDIMIDSLISRSRHVELERELEPWIPDDDNIECPELDNTFDRHWNRGWDQFETNAALFGVKSTFNEELYTTKLDRGPQMRELEKEALRIAKEIEGEDTQDLHLAEVNVLLLDFPLPSLDQERGIHFHNSFDLDEETKYSSVLRGVDDSGYDENEDIWDTENIETFGNVSDSVMNTSTDLKSGGSQLPSSFLSWAACSTSVLPTVYLKEPFDLRQPVQELFNLQVSVEHWIQDKKAGSQEDTGKHMLFEQNQASESEESSLRLKKESSEKGLSADATAYAPSNVLSKAPETTGSSEASEGATTLKIHEATQPAISRAQPGSSSSTSECGNAAPTASAPGLSPSSLNPNAKSFVPLQTPLRPASPVSDGSFYYPTNVAPVSHMQGVPVGIGIEDSVLEGVRGNGSLNEMGTSFSPHQPAMYGPQTTSFQSQQAYFHSNAPQYGQQMLLGQPRQMVYMPTYPPQSSGFFEAQKMDGGATQYNPRTVEEVFRDFKGRRAGMIKALTSEVEEFYQQCDPEKENLCLYGFPSEQWEVNLPAEEVPPELPEPALGINFARDGMQEKDWLSLVAVHSDAWLLSVAFYFGARFGFDKADRKRLFNMINDLPTIFEVVSGTAKKAQKEKTAVSNHSSTKSKSNSKVREPESQGKYPKQQPPPPPPQQPSLKDDEDGLEDEDDDEHGETLCGACGENYASDEFWICCDICEKWFHGKCVKITPARAEHIKQYKCPSCSNKRARP